MLNTNIKFWQKVQKQRLPMKFHNRDGPTFKQWSCIILYSLCYCIAGEIYEKTPMFSSDKQPKR